MSIRAKTTSPPEIEYPDDDGKPLSDNTLQYEWIVTIKGGLDALFRDDPDVFVTGNLLWYPVEGDNKTRQAPDAMVAFGRPKGRRGSYMQWLEGGVAPQVAFEVLSPRNTRPEMGRKRAWYFRFGVEEYYEFDPDPIRLRGWVREGGAIREVEPMSGHVSPRLGVRLEMGEDLTIHGPDGRPFAPYVEIARRLDDVEHERDEIRHERDEFQQQRDEFQQRSERDRLRAERLEARLRELGLEPDG